MNDLYMKEGKQMVFLVGVPRSGTTWLQRMLSNHHKIATAQESHLFNQFISVMVEQWNNALHFKDGRGGVGIPAYFTQQQFWSSLSTYSYNVFSACEEFSNHDIFLEKTPDHLIHVSTINKVIPSAKFIYVTREPYGVIESLLAAGKQWGKAWAPKTTQQAIRLYKNYTKEGERQLSQICSDKKLIVSYEDMVKAPEVILKQTLSFLDLPHNATSIAALVEGKSELKRYGEFAIKNGSQVIEPKGFRRSKKEPLTFFQKLQINLAC